MPRNCCVPMCNSSRRFIKHHRFPIKEENNRQWFKFINCDGITHADIKKLSVCHIHFEQRFFNPVTNRLRIGAYPSLFTSLEISLGKPTCVSLETDLEKTTCIDHCYSRKRHNDHSYTLIDVCRPNKLLHTEVFDTSLVPSTSSHESSTMQTIPDINMVPTTVHNITIDNIQDFLDEEDSFCKTRRNMVKNA